MGNSVSGAATPALCAAISAVELANLLDPAPRSGAGAMAAAARQAAAPSLHGAGRDLLLLAAAGGLFTAAALTHRHLHLHLHNAGRDNRRLSDLLAFMSCASVGALEFLVFVRPAAGGAADPGPDDSERARALGLAALRALPAAASVTFFLGMLLIVVGHIRAGGEGGGGAVAGVGPIRAPAVGLLSKMALAAAAALVCLMAIALYGAC